MMCVSSITYQIALDDELLGPVKPTRGLRQGDLLFPYLFIFCIEGLSKLMSQKERCGDIHGCQVSRSAPSLTHLFFADECFLFCRVTKKEAKVVQTTLKVYEKASGQHVNYGKSSISFSRNTTVHVREEFCQLLGMPMANENEKYLGVPTNMERKKKALFRYMKDRIKQQISGWSSRLLSRTEKEELLKLVAQAMPNYLMSVYLLPKDLCAKLERMMNSFWWGIRGDGKRIRWKSWERMSKPKMVGGMGFIRVHDFNLVVIAKQGWRLLIVPNSLLAKIYKARYYLESNFLDVEVGSTLSFIWNGIIKVLLLIRRGVIRAISDGRDIGVYKDPWLIDREDAFVSSWPKEDHLDLRVVDLFVEGRKEWNVEKFR